ncbi:MAG: phosphoribosylaminoimidazolesuccinocarboxamide synthase [Chloroflexi bacterium 54-19]|nr:MAG: phosphoribosylaminoimidazolesuccinocarboxamide synthase [Chloroflexi bacterium 54-19]
MGGVNLSGYGESGRGKVRDFYELEGNRRLVVTTDRQSAFDRVLGLIPFKGQVLNQLSQFWFEQTTDIVPNHLISVPDPNVSIVKKAEMFPVEVIVRGYLTGVTDTSIWMMYQDGQREMYGLRFPDGMRKNEPLPAPIITPTTHAELGAHDRPLSRDEILNEGLVSPENWREIERAALAVFARGQEIARQAGLILVDTKYEFGMIDGRVALVDEVHTPDSSRYWLVDTYDSKFEAGQEPDNFDKELLRLWMREQGFKGEGQPPALTDDIIARLSQRYQSSYERLTGKTFEVDFSRKPEDRIVHNLKQAGF